MTRTAAVASVVVLLAFAAPALAAPPRELFVFGDSFAVGTKPYLPRELRGWRVVQDVRVNRSAAVATKAAALRRRGRGRRTVMHISLGTIDDPAQPERFRAAVRRAMRAAGDRCVVWTNIWRPVREPPDWSAINAVLADEADRRSNLIVVDWAGLVARHREWLHPHDGTHVVERGYRARARAVADATRECYRRLASIPRTSPSSSTSTSAPA